MRSFDDGAQQERSTGVLACAQTRKEHRLSSLCARHSCHRLESLCSFLVRAICVICVICGLHDASASGVCVAQYDARLATASAWPSVTADAPTLIPFHLGDGNGWSSAIAVANGMVSFAATSSNAIPTPLAFTGASATSRVSRMFAVVRVESLDHFLPTLVDSPLGDVRLRKDPTSQEWNLETGVAGGMMTSSPPASVTINGIDATAFSPSPNPKLVEIGFDPAEGVALPEIRIGGAVASPHWRRHWRGGIGEMLLLDGEPTPQQINAIRRYLRLKWGIAVQCDPDPAAQSILREMGIGTGDVFTSVIIIR